eukprot:2591753-Pleurochrysis_carterae.AAC.3
MPALYHMPAHCTTSYMPAHFATCLICRRTSQPYPTLLSTLFVPTAHFSRRSAFRINPFVPHSLHPPPYLHHPIIARAPLALSKLTDLGAHLCSGSPRPSGAFARRPQVERIGCGDGAPAQIRRNAQLPLSHKTATCKPDRPSCTRGACGRTPGLAPVAAAVASLLMFGRSKS